jgi:thymidylate synthase
LRPYTIDDAFHLALQETLKGERLESRAGGCTEVLGLSLSFDPHYNLLQNSRRNLSRKYAAAELIWYLTGRKDASYLVRFAPQYANFLGSRNEAHGAYGPRLLAQLSRILKELHEQPNTRQAVITLFDKSDHAWFGVSKDIPCTCSLQFLIRGGKLNLITTMRSNDLWLGFGYDAFCFTSLQRMVAATLGVGVGRYYHNVGSMHIYDKNLEAAKEASRSYTTSLRTDFSYEAVWEPPSWDPNEKMYSLLHNLPHEVEEYNALEDMDGRFADFLQETATSSDFLRSMVEWTL